MNSYLNHSAPSTSNGGTSRLPSSTATPPPSTSTSQNTEGSSKDGEDEEFATEHHKTLGEKEKPLKSVSAVDKDESGVEPEGWREIKLSSVRGLRQIVSDRTHSGLRELISEHSFVGCVTRSLALVQHSTALYLVNVPRLSEELFYQV